LSALKEKMKMDMELRGFSPNTVKAYLTQVRNYAQYYNLSPELMGEKEIRGYLYYCSTEKHFSESHLNIIYSSLKFLYLKTMQRKWNIDAIPRRKRIEKLPIILSRKEISTIFSATTNLKHKAILMTIYGGGLRVSEACRLKIVNIDSKNMQILIQQGKGKKDRYTLLSNQNLSVLRTYYKRYNPSTWLFCGATGDKHITERSIQRIFQEAKIKAGIKKNVSVHNLRHCFATHLLEQGTDLCYIQELMGHASIGTTMIYLHLRKLDVLNVISPLDRLEDEREDRKDK
jgi:integrase/recombinase XerD